MINYVETTILQVRNFCNCQARQWYILSRDDSWRVSKFIVQAPILNQLFLRNYNVHITTTITYISCHRAPIIALYTERENNAHLYKLTQQCRLSLDRLTFPSTVQSLPCRVLERFTKHIFLLSQWPFVSHVCCGWIFAFVSNTVFCFARPAASHKHVWWRARRWECWIFTTSASDFKLFKEIIFRSSFQSCGFCTLQPILEICLEMKKIFSLIFVLEK